MKTHLTRRRFIKFSVGASSAVFLPTRLAAAAEPARKLRSIDKLNIGLIGGGGRATDNLAGVSSENIAAICDVDEVRAANAFQKYPGAKRYEDFRVMLEREKGLDAVVVSTPDHVHAFAGIMAMKLGKHVYCEKPLTHSIYEARLMRETAKKYKVATQMGNQGHSFNGTRRAVELLRANAVGPVREVHVWSDRPIWPQGIDRPKETPAPPPTLNWDLWLGPAPERPYHPAYLPFNWRGWWDFGTGALGDMACHCADTAFWGLELGYPTSIEAEASDHHPETAPLWSIIRYEFPARGSRPAVKFTWYDGHKKPNASLLEGIKIPDNGCIVVGSEGKMLFPDWHADKFQLYPLDKFAGFKGPDQTIPRTTEHHKEWIEACKGGPPALSNFDYSAVLTETVLLGNVALRVGKKIEWDGKNAKAKNCPEAAQYIHREYRKGWHL